MLPAARFLAALAEYEVVDRARRRIERHVAEAHLPAGKTLASFDFDSVPMLYKAQVWHSPQAMSGSRPASICCCSVVPSQIHPAHLATP